jgi:membrane-associated phospholipid phosphatase
VSEADWTIVRRVALAGYVVILLIWVNRDGIPIGRDRIILWTLAGLVCACIGRTWRSVGHLLIDWVPFAAVLIAYDYSRGLADSIGLGVHYDPQINADKWLFFGHVPTVWLQERMYHIVRTLGGGYTVAGSVQWWEVVFSATYVTHYLASFVLAGVLWARNRERFQAFARRFVTLAFMGFLTYALFPAAPPWLAARHGELPPAIGRYGRGLEQLHLGVVRDVIDKGSAVSNVVAAIPSLHLGFATLVVITLWRSWPTWTRPLLVCYPLLMGFTLVVTGEHYVIDLILGVIYALGSCWLWDRIEPRWDRRSAERRALRHHAAGNVTTNAAPPPVGVS